MVKWSFSGLKDFVNCPRQYHETKVLKRVQKQQTPEMKYGTEVHKALEDYARDGTPLPEFYLPYKPAMDALLAIPGERHLELQMAVDAHRQPCAFDSPDYQVRGIADFVCIKDERTAFVVDYKTGSNKYPDTKQLQLMALLLFAKFPKVEVVEGMLLFITRNSVVQATYYAEHQDRLWGTFAMDVARLEMAEATGSWAPKPSPLCGWCPVTSCEHWEKRRRK